MTRTRHGEDGFTLVEALVALVILGFASVALLRAAETHIRRIGDLEGRAIAQWVAENRLAEIAAAPGAAPTLPEEVAMLGRSWRVEQQLLATEDPDLAAVELRVREATTPGATVFLSGFVDLGGVR